MDTNKNSPQRSWHILGILSSVGGLVLLTLGVVFNETAIVYSSSQAPSPSYSSSSTARHWLGFAFMMSGSALTMVVMVYACITLSRKWKLYGCATPPEGGGQKSGARYFGFTHKSNINHSSYAAFIGANARRDSEDFDKFDAEVSRDVSKEILVVTNAVTKL